MLREEAAKMARLTYPVILREDDNDTYLVEFPDVPAAITYGETKEEALAHAVDALATAIQGYMSDRRDVPQPSIPKAKQTTVTLPLLMGTKITLYETMRAQHIGKAELARRLDVHLPQVDRLLDLRHQSQLGQVEAAFAALGKAIDVVVVVPRPRAAKVRSARIDKSSRLRITGSR
jgi:antitoxin HicB